MKKRFPLRALLTLLACAGVCAAQGAAARRDAPPDLVILRLKLDRQLDPSPRPAGPARDADGPAADPAAPDNPGGMRTVWSRGPAAPYIYQYSVEVRNGHAKQIRWLSWECVLTDPDGKRELGRHRFDSFEKIDPAGRKTLRGRTRSPPSRIVSAESLGKGGGAVYKAHVEFRCVAYEDGSWWHLASVQESECVEAERRGKSR